METRVEVEERCLAAFCARWHVRRLSLFGSVLRPDFDDASDVDILMEFEEGTEPGFFGIAQTGDELSRVLGGRRVDIRTPDDLSPLFRDDVMRAARVRYVSP